MVLLPLGGEEGRTSGILEDLSDTLPRLSGTLQIMLSTDLLSYGHSLNMINM